MSHQYSLSSTTPRLSRLPTNIEEVSLNSSCLHFLVTSLSMYIFIYVKVIAGGVKVPSIELMRLCSTLSDDWK